MFVRSVVLPAVCLTWLMVIVGGRPSLQLGQQPLSEKGEVRSMLRAPVEDTFLRSVREAAASESLTPRGWARLLEVTSKYKGSRSRSRKGSSKGCFGLRMDRIGSMSKFGC
ncbi:C-type natriuretic peptide 2-like [Mobula birostris]|uniref:C-type natriuretic peptide 2-like n=1 Tax=Mobula birostris TaxID=1983395 RepID=UPI003B27CF6E